MGSPMQEAGIAPDDHTRTSYQPLEGVPSDPAVPTKQPATTVERAQVGMCSGS